MKRELTCNICAPLANHCKQILSLSGWLQWLLLALVASALNSPNAKLTVAPIILCADPIQGQINSSSSSSRRHVQREATGNHQSYPRCVCELVSCCQVHRPISVAQLAPLLFCSVRFGSVALPAPPVGTAGVSIRYVLLSIELCCRRPDLGSFLGPLISRLVH